MTTPTHHRSPRRILTGAMFALAVVAAAGAAGAEANRPPVFGYLEKAELVPHGFPMNAKLDTGADNSSVNAEIVNRYERDGKPWIAFNIQSADGTELHLKRPVIRVAKVKRHSGKAQQRPVVMLSICLGSLTREVQVNLVDRSKLTYNLLIGRSFMAGLLLVDPARKFTTAPNCAKETGQ